MSGERVILPTGTTTCGNCGKTVRRVGQSVTSEYEGVPPICSRTLVGGNFLASCGNECNFALRVKAGCAGRIPKRSH